MNPNRSSDTTDRTASSNTTQPTYTHLEPSCPICGNTKFESTDEGVSTGYETHTVHVTCMNCNTALTIEYRAIDVSWYDGHDGVHSAVSQHLLEPTHTKYLKPALHAPLPERAVLEQLEWPRCCDDCGKLLTGNDMATDPGTPASSDSDATELDQVLFQCPHCDHITSGTTTDGT